MKKLLLGTIIAIFTSATFAAGYGAAGCGLGSLVLGDKSGFMQVFASTTNGTSGSQTFGITSGTSNCGSGGKSATVFIEANKVSLSNDIARGNGETLEALAQVYGVKNVTEMKRILKPNYKRIFSKKDDAVAINTEITTLLKDNQLL